MKFPILKKFLDNPSYIDNQNYGKQWSERREYERRWSYIKTIFKSFPITYFYESEYSYYLYMEMPSERKGNTYDIVIHFFTDDEYVKNESSLMNYNIRIFSNNPVFGFHFGHANYIKGILIDFLAAKFPRDILENKAMKYNPKDAIGYCHTFYEAGSYLIENPRFLNKSLIKSKLLPFNQEVIFKLCKHLDQTIDEYRTMKNSSENRKRFGQNNAKIGDNIDDVISKAKQKADSFKTGVGKALDKISPKKSVSNTSGVRVINAKKSNSKKSAVNIIKPKKKIR